MAGRTAWERWSNHFSKIHSDEFKQKITPFIHLLNRSLEPSNFPGADFIVSSDNDPFAYVIQCQGFDNPILGDKQAQQIKQSIHNFISSGAECEKYYVIHNQQHGLGGKKFEEFMEKVNQSLKQLELTGKARETKLLQRQDFLKLAEKELKLILSTKLQQYSERYRVDIQEKLKFGKYYISAFPFTEREILFRDCDVPELNVINQYDNSNIQEILASPAKSMRWTLVHGEAGAGKTTTALNTRVTPEKVNVFVRCDTFDFKSLQSGTNNLLEQILLSQKLLDDEFDEADRQMIYDVAGATLSGIFENSDTYTLIFDGLDENRFYSYPKAKGLKQLSDRLTNFHCPIILITRTSHFNSLFEEFNNLIANPVTKNPRARKKARVLEFLNWTEENVMQLVNQALTDNLHWNQCELQRIEEFQQLLKNKKYSKLYGDLPLSPLFLNFILEDIIYEGLRSSTRPSLIYHWVRRKIERDIKINYRSFLVNKDSKNFEQDKAIDKMLYLMERIARKMLEETDNGYELKEFIKAEEVEAEASKIFNVSSTNIIDILLNSVLTSQAQLSRKKYHSSKDKVTFVFRIFQEYFLASSLKREQSKVYAYPESVKTFYREIEYTIQQEPDTDFADFFKSPPVVEEQKTSETHLGNTYHIHNPEVVQIIEKNHGEITGKKTSD